MDLFRCFASIKVDKKFAPSAVEGDQQGKNYALHVPRNLKPSAAVADLNFAGWLANCRSVVII
jgi:hypothetical protein